MSQEANEAGEELGAYLAEQAPGALNHVFYTSGGSEGIETALKIARQYHLETGQPRRHRIISRRQAYHGATLGALAVGGQTARREPYAPMLMDVAHIAPCYAYRERLPEESEWDYGQRVAGELEEAVLRLGPETVAAFIAEPVVGASLGAVTAVPGYFRRIREICDQYGILLIFDEVFCGMGRTGSLFAFEQEEVVPDLCVIAKGLSGGYQPIGAVMVADLVHQAILDGSGQYKNLFTYSGHPVACAAALAVQKVIQSQDLLSRVRTQSERLRSALQTRLADHPKVGDIRGRGLMMAVELVEDRQTKQPFDAAHQLANRLRRQGMAHGMVCYPMNGVADGIQGDHILVAPPYIIAEEHVEEIADKVRDTVQAALAELPG